MGHFGSLSWRMVPLFIRTMQSPKKKDLICLLDYSAEEIRHILDLALHLKQNRGHDDPSALKGKTGVLIFEKPSLRTRITFEVAIHELGGHSVNLEAAMVRIGERETVEDVARNLERWVHLLIARTYAHSTVEQLAKFSSVPVVNALTDTFHPCQALAFALTLQEHRGTQKQKVVFIGDGNNVCNSLMAICAKLGHDFALVCPPGYEAPEAVVSQCRNAAKTSGASIVVTDSFDNVLSSATAIYTDVWASMGQENEAEQRSAIFRPYQVNAELLSKAPEDVIVSHCLPAHREEEITAEVLDGKNSVALDEAENRLHVQKATVVHLFS